MESSQLISLTGKVQRISYGGMQVDLVTTSCGTVRVGSMPDIAKFMTEHGFREEIVVVPDWEVSMAGDSRTGEEFVLWHAQSRGGLTKQYVGHPPNVGQLHHHLGRIFPYFFDDRRLAIVRKKWLANWFQPRPAESRYRMADLEICLEHGNVVLVDEGRVVYDRRALAPVLAIEDLVEAQLATTARDRMTRDCLEVVPVGCGNGFHGTAANTLVRFDRQVLWVDPCGYPAHVLSRQDVHWDDVTHYLFTHNHEDHVQGLTACLQRAQSLGRLLNLVVAPSVLRLIRELYRPLFPEFDRLVKVVPLIPGKKIEVGQMIIESRWNHHILPYGTIGLKISAGGRSFGYSGDTKYDEEINAVLGREELAASWFAPCDLIFHEIEFDNPNSVHTHFKQVQALQRQISGKVLGYHTPFLANSPFELAVEGRCYRLDSL